MELMRKGKLCHATVSNLAQSGNQNFRNTRVKLQTYHNNIPLYRNINWVSDLRECGLWELWFRSVMLRLEIHTTK